MKTASELVQYLAKTGSDLLSGAITLKVARERNKAADKVMKAHFPIGKIDPFWAEPLPKPKGKR